VPGPPAGYGAGMEKKERSVPDDAPGVEIPDDNDDDDLRDADALEKLGKSLPPDDDGG
jgi:hypothetical protein